MRNLVTIICLASGLGASCVASNAQEGLDIPDVAALQLQYISDDLSRADLFEVMKNEERKVRPQDFEEPFVLRGNFVFPNDTEYDYDAQKPRKDEVFGIDISHHNGSTVPLENLHRHKVRYVFMKATQGSGFRDGRFASFWSRLDAVNAPKIHRGAYHFLSANPREDGKAQAVAFLSVLKAQGGLKPTDMPPVVDLEWDKACRVCPDRWKGQDPDRIVEKVLTWLEVVERATGRKPMIYTARSWIHDVLGQTRVARFDGYPFWTADYSKSSRALEQPNIPKGASHVLWQFTDSAELAVGYSGNLDANIYKGSDDKFYADFGLARFQ